MVKHETQVAIIGAGAVGCSIAYYLADQGVGVTVIEAASIGAGTTSATLGLVWVQSKEPAEYSQLHIASARLHSELADKFDEDVGLRRPGGLIICPDKSEFERLVGITNRLNAAVPSYQAQVLTPKGVCELEPLVSTKIAGGIYGPHDGVVNPIKLVMNLASLAKRNSARFLLHTTANRILKDGNGINGVETSQGLVRADIVVVSAGTGMPGLIQPLGLNIPLDYVRGEILVTAPIKPIINYPSRHVLQTVEGNLLLGSTHDRDGLERITTIESAQKIANNAIRSFPILEELTVIRQYAGIRPMPKDGKPYLGPVERIPGLFLAVSHSGITLSPIYGKIISDLIVKGQTDFPLNLYRPERYSDSEVEIDRPDYT